MLLKNLLEPARITLWASILVSLIRPVCLHVSIQVEELAEGLVALEALVLVAVVDPAHVCPGHCFCVKALLHS